MKSLGYAFVALSLMTGSAAAQISDDVVKLGVITDMNSWGRDNSGPGSVEAARMAIEDFGPTVLGKRIELVFADHQQKADVGLAVARQWYDQDKVDVVLDVPNSAIAFGIHNLAREKNKLVIFSGAGASALTDKACSPNTVQWTYDTYALAKSTGTAVTKEGGDSWFFITADYTFGHQLEAETTRFITQAGGKVLGGVRHPTNTPDYSSYLVQAQQSGAKIVGLANVGLDTDATIKQAGEFGVVQHGQRMAALLLFISDVHAIGLQNAQGTLMTTAFYWGMSPEARVWSMRFFKRMNAMPTMIHAGIYGSVIHYLKAVQAAGTDDPAKVMTKMKEMRINDFMTKDGYLRDDGRVMRDMYLARVKKPEESKEPWDYLEIVRTIPAEEAFRPVAESECPLLKK